MATRNLEATLRDSVGTAESRRLRHKKQIPATLYGSNKPLSLSIDAHVFETKFKHISENEIINLTVGKKSYDVLIKDYQADILKNRILHLDFMEVEKGKNLRTHVPVKLVGISKGVREGGILENPLHELEIECLPNDLPESIEIDVADLDVGHALHVNDVKVAKGLKVLNNGDQVVAFIGHAKASVVNETEQDEIVNDEE